MTNTSSNKRIAKNTMLLYLRMIIILGVTLFTSRVILQTLGVDDYGIYNVVGGVVTMFSFISASLATASQRFITFELGKGGIGDVSNVFSTCLYIHILLAIVIAIIIEPIGLWFIKNKLMIPEERLSAAIWVFHFSILSMAVMIIGASFNALIIAHESMNAFALVSIVDAGLRLGIAYSLLAFDTFDRLIIYGLLIFLAQCICTLCYALFCKKSYKNVRYSGRTDRILLIKMAKFASWSVFGNVAFLTYTQGLNLLLGSFFSPVVNTARGVAVQIQGAVNCFVSSFQTAINPQITKNYAAGNLREMIKLVFCSSRFSFYLLMILTVPVLLRTQDILTIWLGNVPDHTVSFVQLILITTWINSIANPLIISVKATGNIKRYESTVGSLMIAILPISYIFLRLGYPPEIVFVVNLTIESLAMIFRIWITRSLINFSLIEYIKNVMIRVLVVASFSFLLSYLISEKLPNGFWPTILLFMISAVISIIMVMLIGLETNERIYIFSKIKRR